MKKGIVFSLIAASIAVCSFTLIKHPKPTTFKQDWENYYDLLVAKGTELSLPNADTMAILIEIKEYTDFIDLKWDVDYEMRNATSIWPTVMCMANCTYSYYSCQKKPPVDTHNGDEVAYPIPYGCVQAFTACVYRNCN